MAAKFSMANGLFDQGDHAEASSRMQNAMEDLRIKNERQEEAAAIVKEQEAIVQAEQEQTAYLKTNVNDHTYDAPPQANQNDDSSDDDDDEYLKDPELERYVSCHHFISRLLS